jgi:hypothetical protein
MGSFAASRCPDGSWSKAHFTKTLYPPVRPYHTTKANIIDFLILHRWKTAPRGPGQMSGWKLAVIKPPRPAPPRLPGLSRPGHGCRGSTAAPRVHGPARRQRRERRRGAGTDPRTRTSILECRSTSRDPETQLQPAGSSHCTMAAMHRGRAHARGRALSTCRISPMPLSTRSSTSCRRRSMSLTRFITA